MVKALGETSNAHIALYRVKAHYTYKGMANTRE